MPKPEHRRLGKGGALKGPNILHCLFCTLSEEHRQVSKGWRMQIVNCLLCTLCEVWASVTNVTPLSDVR